jgi:hypothetical protein
MLATIMDRIPPPLPRNPQTYRLYRRDAIRQVYLPLGTAVVAAVALTTLAILAGLGVVGTPVGASTWADVSLIFLIVIALAFGLAPLALVAALVYGMVYALRYLPGYARVAQDFLAQASRTVRQAADQVAKPVIGVERGAAAVGGAIRGLSGKDRKK